MTPTKKTSDTLLFNIVITCKKLILGNNLYYHQYARPTALCETHLLAGQTRNARAANAFPALILIGCRGVKQLPLANENLRIPEDSISMPKLARICTCSLCSSVELEISSYFKMEDQLFSSQNSD